MVREISSRTLQMKRAEDLDFERLLLLFRDLDVTKVLVKRLAKTDGPQGQIAGLGANPGFPTPMSPCLSCIFA
jgi:hypothetical protein